MSTNDKDEFYDYGYTIQSDLRSCYNETRKASTQFHALTSLTRIVLVILLRVGFVLVQAGSVPVNNVNLILLQNAVDVCWVTASYTFVGFILSHNGVAGSMDDGYWIGHPKVDKDEAITGLGAVAIASAISTCGIVGRTHTVGYLVIGFLLSALVQPFLIHWAWSPKGWMKRNVLAGKDVTFRDYAGSGTVHLVGGLSGLIGCLALGRRILRLRDIDEASIAAGSSGTVFAGQLLIFVGLQSLSLTNFEVENSRAVGEEISRVYINNLLAGSSCCLIVVTLHFLASREAFNHWTVMRCVQATVSGLVVVSAGVDAYSPPMAIGLASAGGILFYLISRQIFRSALEDYCNVVAIYLASAIFGSTVAPLCDIGEGSDATSISLNLSWQLICLLALVSLVTIVMSIAFAALQFFGVLRNRAEHLNHMRAVVATERAPARSCMQRVFFPDNEAVYLQPGPVSSPSRRTSVGPRFREYQREIDNVERGRSVDSRRVEASEKDKRHEIWITD